MRVLIVYAHPEPRSFNSSLLSVALDVFRGKGHEVTVSDLYAQRFNPVAGPNDVVSRKNSEFFSLGEEQMHASTNALFSADVSTEIGRLLRADLLILQFPMWWFSMPAILKGWVDRVFAFGSAYDLGQTWEQGVFTGRRAMLSISTSAPAAAFAPDGRNGDIERVLWPIHAGILGIVGYTVMPPFVAHGIPFIGEEAMNAELDRYHAMLEHIDTVRPLYFHTADQMENYRLRPEIEPATPGQHRGPRSHMLADSIPKRD